MIWKSGHSLLRCPILSHRCLSQAQILEIWREESRAEESGQQRRKRLHQHMLQNFWSSYSCHQTTKPLATMTSVLPFPLPMQCGFVCPIWWALRFSSKSRPLAWQWVSLSVGTEAHDDLEEQRAQIPELILSASPPLLEGLSQPWRWILCLGTGKIWICAHKQMHEAEGADKP